MKQENKKVFCQYVKHAYLVEIIFALRFGILGYIIPTLISQHISPVIIGWGMSLGLLTNIIKNKLSNWMMNGIENRLWRIFVPLVIGDILFASTMFAAMLNTNMVLVMFLFQSISFVFYIPYMTFLNKMKATKLAGGKFGILVTKINNNKENVACLFQLLALQVNIAIFYFLPKDIGIYVCIGINTILNVLDTIICIKLILLLKKFEHK